MPEFVAEQYFARTDSAGAYRAGVAARRAAEQLTREGAPVTLVRSIFTPEDETCIYIFETESLELVCLAAERAALRLEHVAEAAGVPTDGSAGDDADADREMPRP
jgi:hypothetical protein